MNTKLYKVITGIIMSLSVLAMSGCATLVNDANIPLEFRFSDGSHGKCTFTNKRGRWRTNVPVSGLFIRRSDDALVYSCKTDDGRIAAGFVESEVEGGKLAASILLLDFGITDAITDKHRVYRNSTIIDIYPNENVVVAGPEQHPDGYHSVGAKALTNAPSQETNEITTN